MKVLIYSWFESGNIGDVLIAKMIMNIFDKRFECLFHDITSGKRMNEPKLIENDKIDESWKTIILNISVFRNIIDFIYAIKSKKKFGIQEVSSENVSLAIFAGGNSLMDLGTFLPGDSITMYRRVRELKKKGIPVLFLFCGVGPYSNLISKVLAKRTFRLLDFISVRDEASLDFCVKNGYSGEIEVWRDPVLFYRPKLETKDKNTIAINIYVGTEKEYESKMINSYIELIRNLRKKYNNYQICLFASETGDRKYSEQVKSAFENDEKVTLVVIKSEEELFELYSKTIVTVGCRMHALITSVICSVPVVAIGWQSKVYSFMKYFTAKDRLVTQTEFCKSPKKMEKMIKEIVESNTVECDNIAKKISEERSKLYKQLDSFFERWNRNGL
ncbi:MAG: polysaccharide pyruvyl transferase family protein [Lachnospiraceae bacterium]|nr:polysaccharide pyruvyl transferase family protein [Lachnospiraceae bacterium]